MEHNKLNSFIEEVKLNDVPMLVRCIIEKHGILCVTKAIVVVCDAIADDHSCSGDRQLEHYWRDNSVKIFNTLNNMSDFIRSRKRAY